MYRLRIPGRRRRSRPIPYDDSAIDGHVYEDDGINSDPEGLVDEFVEVCVYVCMYDIVCVL